MRITTQLFAAACLAMMASAANAQLPFFPGAEGFGGSFTGTAPAAGWFSNATIYRVTTTLDDPGTDGKGAPGTLRGAFRENTADKIIVFDVGGTFRLTEGTLDIKNIQNYYIAGQTAPSPITVYGDTTQITHSNNKQHFNTILRYMTFRRGTENGEDAITFAGGGTNGIATNMILDHVSASWSKDENLSVTNFNTNVTVQYSIIAEAINSSHAYGSLIRPKSDANVSFHHNLYATDKSRNPRPGTYNNETLNLDFRNNVMYNWNDRAGYTGGASEVATEYVNMNYVGNYGIAGPTTPAGQKSNTLFTMDVSSFYSFSSNSVVSNKDYIALQIYQDGNLIDANHNAVRDGVDNGWGMFLASGQGVDDDETIAVPYPDFNYGPNSALPAKIGTPHGFAPVTTQPAANAYEQIMEYVGNYWWSRDAIDSRILGNVESNTTPTFGAQGLIDSEKTAVETAPTTTHAAGYDADNDAMQDAWETIHGGNLVWNADFDNDGYINLIEFINEKGEFPAPAPIVFKGGLNNRYASIMNWKTDDGGITAGSNWQPSKYDLAVIETGSVVVDAVGQHAGTLLIAPNSGDTATLSINSGWLKAAEGVEVGSATGDGTLVIASAGTLFAPIVSVSAQGELRGTGEIVGNVLNDGLVSPGSSPGTLDVSGNFAQNAGGILKMEIASTASFDQLNIGGALMAGGTLDVDLLSFAPAAGDTFDLFDFASAMGSFTLDLPTLAGDLSWDDSNLLVTGELGVIAAAIEENADFDGDGDVDGRDFLVWQRGFGGEGSLETGDANDDGAVDDLDLAIWQNQYATVPEFVSANVAVPEPSTILLISATLVGLLGCRSRAS